MFKNILVPYDDSENSKRAFNYAIVIAKKFDSTITLVTCIHGGYRGLPYSDSREEEALLNLERQEALNRISRMLSSKRLDRQVKRKILDSDSFSKALLTFAKSNKIDLVVMGSRGLEGFKKLLLGSVSSAVSQHSECPVLLVR